MIVFSKQFINIYWLKQGANRTNGLNFSMLFRHFLAVCTLAGHLTGAAAADDDLNVVFINPGNAEAFWGDVSATMAAAADDLAIDLEIIHADRNRFAMVAAAQQVAQRTDLPDYIVIVNELQQAPAMLTALNDVDVPVFVLLNRMTDEQQAELSQSKVRMDRIIGSVVPDNEIAGYEMAVSVVAAARANGAQGPINALALLGDPSTPAALKREAGLRRALDEMEDVSLVRAFPVMWDRDIAYERTQSVLARFGVDVVWSANDQISFGAQQAAVEAGFSPGTDMFFAGLNWSDEGLNAVRSGTMTMTHGGHFFAGAWSMVMLRDHADGHLPAGSHIEFPMSAIRQENANLFLRVFGARDWARIAFDAFLLPNQLMGQYDFSASAILRATQESSG